MTIIRILPFWPDIRTLKKFLSGASALNYMGIRGEYKITKEMLENEKYFDKLFAKWYENRKK
jgi:hypothetical protein